MIRAKLNEEVEQRFRELAMRRFGYGKGSLAKAAEEAILMWISSMERENITFKGDPVNAIDGLLSDVKVDSVELQHRIKDLWLMKVAEDISS
ncbi:hypothetical protein KEJ27_04540 [Candidatus Bathyarchaeota archaeon]|nr:hypothetical protein [Candidatus Bathyarchaeota archaeon]MBS7613799.1 hypothetical protein [Candidatus Bathyarchaeota archaeon]